VIFFSVAILNVDQKTVIKFVRTNVCGIFFPPVAYLHSSIAC